MPLQEKLKIIYQTGVLEEFQDTRVERANVAAFRIATTATRVAPAKLPEPVHQCVTFTKSLLQKGTVISIPKPLLDKSAVSLPVDIPDGCNPVDEAVTVVLGDVPERVFDAEGENMFEVVNTHPEHRVLLTSHHVAQERSRHVTLKRLFLDDADPAHPNRVVARSLGPHLHTIDVIGLATNMTEALMKVCVWRTKKATAVTMCQPLPIANCSSSSDAPFLFLTRRYRCQMCLYLFAYKEPSSTRTR